MTNLRITNFGGVDIIILWTLCSTLLNISSLYTLALNVPTKEVVFDQYSDLIKVHYQSSIKSILVFHYSNVTDYRPMIVDKTRREIIVGARDAVFRLNAQDMSVSEIFDWPPSSDDVEMCQMKGQKEVDCHNFIRTLVFRDDKVLICGTNAFKPMCTWRRIIDLKTKIRESFDGVGYAPFSPNYNATYVMTEDGQFITGVVTDFAGHDPTILRLIPANRILRTAKANNRWLHDPTFVSSFEDKSFVYFFFREPAVESTNCGKFVYSRVARLCKNDVGGDIVLQDHWTTFSKARLNCSSPGGGQNFGFDHLQSVHFVPQKDVMFATFSTAEGGLFGSAICVYSMANLHKAFAGPYRHQTNPNSFWTPETNSDPNFQCDIQGVTSTRPGLTKRPLVDAQKYQLMYDAVQPNVGQPVYSSIFEKYSFVAVDVVSSKQNGDVFVIFVVTGEGLMKKFTLYSLASTAACLIEIVQIVPSDEHFDVFSVELYKEMGALFVTTSRNVFKIPVQRCSRHTKKDMCLEAKDPYCGWDERSQQCTTHSSNMPAYGWHQRLDGCPPNNVKIDGQYGEWSSWSSCPQYDSSGDSCLCRTRACDNPRPRLHGKPCIGPAVQVGNCTQHGSWTSWADWSACTQTCGNAAHRTRKRYCSSPPPAYGGRICLGLDTQQELCPLLKCPIPTPAPIHGGWSEWNAWDVCSKQCNGGFQKRTRSCNNPTPLHDGRSCYDSPVEYRSCNEEPCSELRKWSDWTPWLQSNITSSGGVLLKRHRFACHARVEDSGSLSVSSARSEEKYCAKNGDNCNNSPFLAAIDGSWSQWSLWTACSASCGNGTQSRSRACNEPSPSGNGMPCSGHSKETRQCNAHSCESVWSCWSDYSDCSVTCGNGNRYRTRQCMQLSGTTPCRGDRAETSPCEAGPCSQDGYGEWTGWSSCSKLGVQVRIRPCLSVTFCKGVPDAQMSQCYRISDKNNDISNAAVYQSSDESRSSSSTLILASAVVAAFVGGILITIIFLCYAIRRRSNCWYALVGKKQLSPPAFIPVNPPTPTAVKTSNIYTPPPSLRNIHPTPNITMNPLAMNNFASDNNEYEGMSEQETTLTLKRTMRASLNSRDYL